MIFFIGEMLMKTKSEIYCDSFDDISEIISCVDEDGVVSREDSYKIKTLLEKCYLEVIKKIDKGYIKDEDKSRLAKSIFERTYMVLSMDRYNIGPNQDYYYPLYMILHEWDDNCKYCGIKYDAMFCEDFIFRYDIFQPVHI